MSDKERSPAPVDRESNEADHDVLNPGNNLYVANISHRTTEEDLNEMFSKYGRLEKCEIILDPLTHESRGFAFVTYEDIRDANDAVQELNGKDIHGHRMRVEHAKRKCGHAKTPGKYLGPKLASIKYGRDRRGHSRDRGYDNRRGSRSRSRDRYSRHNNHRGSHHDRRYDSGHARGGDNERGRYDSRRSRR